MLAQDTVVKLPIHFAIPGNIDSLTGGYGYDRRLLAELTARGMPVAIMPLSSGFPAPSDAALADAEMRFAALPDDSLVLADGLAWGVMDEIAHKHGERLRIIALCHHPLALESGLALDAAARLHRREQRALEAARAVVVTSAMTASILSDQFSIPRSRITIALPGTDRQAFAPCSGNPPLLLTVATITRRKAHDVLVAALARLTTLEWTARFVGGMQFDPAWAEQIRDKVIEAGLAERIVFTGSVTNTQPEYARADLFVLPSHFEGYGMVFAEALACGLPIVAARAGAVPDVVPEAAGVLVPPGDVDALAAALGSLLARPQERKRLQSGARLAGANLPTWADTATSVANLIHQLDQETTQRIR